MNTGCREFKYQYHKTISTRHIHLITVHQFFAVYFSRFIGRADAYIINQHVLWRTVYLLFYNRVFLNTSMRFLIFFSRHSLYNHGSQLWKSPTLRKPMMGAYSLPL